MDREILSYQGAKLLFALISFLTLIEGLCIIGQSVFLAGLISSLFSGRSFFSEGDQIVLFFIAVTVRYLCVLLIRTAAYRFADRTSSDMRRIFLDRLFQVGPKAVKKEGTGTLVSLSLEGVSQARQYLELFIPKLAANGILPVMILVFVFLKDPVSSLILLITMPVLILFMILLGLAAQKKMDDRWTSYRILSNHFLDSLRGLPTLRYLGLSKIHAKSIERVSDRYRKMTMGTLRLAFLSSFALDFFTMLSIAFVAVSLGLRLVDGHILLDPALTVLILAPEYFLPVRELGQDYHATLDGKEAAHKLNHLNNQLQKEPTNDDAVSFPEKEWGTGSTMVFENISAAYSDGNGKEALKGISFKINGFEKIGIVGASGAGKSTFIDVISGFLKPSSGCVTINGSQVTLEDSDWHDQITYIPQHPYLFSGSLKENIAFYAPQATDSEIHSALQAAGLESLVDRLPRGLEEKIGAGGRTLSGGQEQRVALARAFLCNRPILLLDEPTAHLDIETEYELKETMIRLFENKLVFMATHRLHWMDQMDRLIVVDDHTIKESGTQDQLILKNGTYAALVRSQLEGIL